MKLSEHNTNKEVYTQIEATPEQATGGSNIFREPGEENKGGKNTSYKQDTEIQPWYKSPLNIKLSTKKNMMFVPL